jgi:type II secretory ATPase GspE/PulE/Tfp pilus assembly ATPase PilB-like protein
MKTQRASQPEITQELNKLFQEAHATSKPPRIPALVSAILADALREGVSDVHLDPAPNGYQLRFRIDGVLVDTARFEKDPGLHVLRAFKTHADLDPATAGVPKAGRAEFTVGDRTVAVRVATMPTVSGEKLALRLLKPVLARLGIEELGLSPPNFEVLSDAIHDARGMILVSGPTGSGKTTTAYALLHELKNTNRAIVTIEEPVEYVIDGITQIQINEKQGLNFAEGVKGMLRLDPDLIFMGEMRDHASARAALDAADSGHAFLSTLHARDTAGIITALRNFGIVDHQIAATLDLVVAQRLIRRLCPACRKQEPPTPSEIHWLKSWQYHVPTLTWHATGCPQCRQSGYQGRIGIFELYRLHEMDADLILQHADEHTLRRHIRHHGMLSLTEDALLKARDGITSLAEIQTTGGNGFYTSPSPAPDIATQESPPPT